MIKTPNLKVMHIPDGQTKSYFPLIGTVGPWKIADFRYVVENTQD